jgi:hypothetical protein
VCESNVTWSAERAIRMSDPVMENERPEYSVGCVRRTLPIPPKLR